MIHKVKLLVSNVYVVQGKRSVLVDTGAPNNAERILKAMAQIRIQPQDISLILLTHAHSDHAGSAKELKRLTGAPIAVHRGDLAMLRRGTNGTQYATDLEARISQPFVVRPFPATDADCVLDDTGDLSEWGIAARWIHTPGHSDGSISLLFEDGDAIIGDVLRGGLMGGAVLADRPKLPFFLPDLANKPIICDSVQHILEAGAQQMYVGHGGPLKRQAVETWLNDRLV